MKTEDLITAAAREAAAQAIKEGIEKGYKRRLFNAAMENSARLLPFYKTTLGRLKGTTAIVS